MAKLSLTDKKILYYLNSNCRLSNANIGNRCGISKQAVKQKIDSFIKKGILTKFITIYDTEKIGYTFNNIYLELNQQAINETNIHRLSELEETCWIAKGIGKWNLIVCTLSRNNREFKTAINKISKILRSSLINYEIFAVVDAYVYPYKILFSHLDTKYDFQAYVGSTKFTKFDKIDYQIMYLLSQDARQTSAQIADKLEQNQNIIRYRIKKLVGEQIITKFTTLMDLKELDLNWYYVLLKLNYMNEKEEQQFIQKLSEFEGIFYIIRGVGKYNICFEIHAKSSTKLEQILKKVTEEFKNTIKKIDTIEILKEQKCDFFPYTMREIINEQNKL